MSYHLKGLALIIMLIATPTLAQTPAEDEAAAEPLSMEFLEFISSWETDLGDWVGPSNFEDDSFDQLYEKNSETDDDETQR